MNCRAKEVLVAAITAQQSMINSQSKQTKTTSRDLNGESHQWKREYKRINDENVMGITSYGKPLLDKIV